MLDSTRASDRKRSRDFGIRPVVNPLSFEEHRELGRELQNTRQRLLQLASMVASVYGQQSLPAFHFTKLNDALDRTCEELQAQAAQDCPGTDASQFYK